MNDCNWMVPNIYAVVLLVVVVVLFQLWTLQSLNKSIVKYMFEEIGEI